VIRSIANNLLAIRNAWLGGELKCQASSGRHPAHKVEANLLGKCENVGRFSFHERLEELKPEVFRCPCSKGIFRNGTLYQCRGQANNTSLKALVLPEGARRGGDGLHPLMCWKPGVGREGYGAAWCASIASHTCQISTGWASRNQPHDRTAAGDERRGC
jgi:hypothetical protein